MKFGEKGLNLKRLKSGFSHGSVVNNLPAMQEMQAEDAGSIPGSRRSPGVGNDNSFVPVFLPGKKSMGLEESLGN